MSGGGGGPARGRPQEGDLDCASLVIRTILSSPDPDVLDEVEAGDVLSLSRPDPSEPRILAVTSNERVAGSITTGRQADLVQCMDADYSFIARITEIDGGACHVEVRPEAG